MPGTKLHRGRGRRGWWDSTYFLNVCRRPPPPQTGRPSCLPSLYGVTQVSSSPPTPKTLLLLLLLLQGGSSRPRRCGGPGKRLQDRVHPEGPRTSGCRLSVPGLGRSSGSAAGECGSGEGPSGVVRRPTPDRDPVLPPVGATSTPVRAPHPPPAKETPHLLRERHAHNPCTLPRPVDGPPVTEGVVPGSRLGVLPIESEGPSSLETSKKTHYTFTVPSRCVPGPVSSAGRFLCRTQETQGSGALGLGRWWEELCAVQSALVLDPRGTAKVRGVP